MLPEDISDLIIAVFFILLLIVVGTLFQPSKFISKEEYVYAEGDLELRDEEEVFFLNFLRKEVDDKSVGDLIVLSENNRDLIETIEKGLRESINFYGKRDFEYGLKIVYSNEDIEEFGSTSNIETKGIKQNLPSLSGGLIKLQFTFHTIYLSGG